MTHAALKDLEAGLPRGHGVTTLRCQLWEPRAADRWS